MITNHAPRRCPGRPDLFLLLCVIAGVSDIACGGSQPTQQTAVQTTTASAPVPAPSQSDSETKKLEAMAARFAPVELAVDLAALPANERQALAKLVGVEPKPVGKEFGVVPEYPTVAVIDEATCIGCTKCIQACPVDAIVGASRAMHTVIAAECTGCELCIPPCPVDCIVMQPAPGHAH